MQLRQQLVTSGGYVRVFIKNREGATPSKYYSYDFSIHGKRYRGSTGETNRARAEAIGALVFAQTRHDNDLILQKAPRQKDLNQILS
jgi:hypothetical protein